MKAIQGYSSYVATAVASSMVSPMWNEFMEAIGMKEEKDIKDRLAGMSNAQISDVVLAVSKKVISSYIPLSSNLLDITDFGGTGMSTTSTIKKAYGNISSAVDSLGTTTPA